MEDNSQETAPDIFHDFFENLEEFLETYEVEDPMVCQHQLGAALAPQSPVSPKAPEGQDSILDQLLEDLQMPGPPNSQAQAGPQKPTQNQVSALDPLLNVQPIDVSPTPQGPAKDKFNVVDQFLKELMEPSSWRQNMSCSTQSNPTAASHKTPDRDVQKTFSEDQTLPEGSTETSGSEQTKRQINMALSGAPGINRIQMSLTGNQTLHGIQWPFSLGGFVSGNQMPINGAQIPWGTMTSFTGDQAQCGSQMSPTAHQSENVSQMCFSMDTFIQQNSTVEDKSQNMSTNIFHENGAEFLQSCEAEDPAIPTPKLCAPLTPQDSGGTREAPDRQSIFDKLLKEVQTPGPGPLQAQGSTNEPSHNQANAPDPLPEGPQFSESLTVQGQDSLQLPTEEDIVLYQRLQELVEMPSWEQDMSFSAQSNPTAASHMTPYTGVLKIFSGDQTLQEGQTNTPGSEQTPCGNQMPYTSTQIINGIQMPFVAAQMLWGNQTPSSGDQTPRGSQTSLTGQQTVYGTPVPIGTNQSFSRNQVPHIGAQILLVNQVPFSGVHTINGNQMLRSGVQMIPVTGLPTMIFIGHQTSSSSQPVTQSGTQNLCGIQMGPQGLPLPQSGFLHSSVPLVQGPSQESRKSNKPQRRGHHINTDGPKRYACTFQGCGQEYTKPSQLRIHERIHTGDKPYVCDMKGCLKKFSRTDELSRHMKTHTGERPYRCPKCHKNFARSDHLKQHARVHR